MSTTARKATGYTLFLLFVINLLNFFDRTIPALVLEPIRREFSLDDTALGLLNTAFTLIYAIAGIPLGRLSDKYMRTRILAGGVFVWSLMTGASGAAWNYASFFLIRMGVGIGEASCAPAANSMIGDMYRSERRARALGLFMLGLPVGTLLCYVMVGPIAQRYGWRVPFYLAAVPGFVIALLALFLPEPVRGSQETYQVSANKTVDKPFRRILAVPTLWWIIVSGATVNFAAYSIGTFLPAMLIRYHGLNVAQAGGVGAIVLGLTGLISLTAGGWLADKVHASAPRGRLMLGAISMLVAAPLLWFGFAQPTGQVTPLTVLLAGGWLLYFMYFVTVYPSIQDVIEPRLRATAMAVYFFFQYVLGGGLGSTVTGALSDLYARQAMAAAGATEMTNAFRAVGLQSALGLVVPLMILLTGIALLLAARSFVRDAERTRLAAQAAG